MQVVNIRRRIIDRLKRLVLQRTGHFWPFANHTVDSLIDIDAIVRQLGPKPKDLDWTIDHVIPLAFFDFRFADQVKLAFSPENHAWAAQAENKDKGCRLPDPIPPELEKIIQAIRKNFDSEIFLSDFLMRAHKNRPLIRAADRLGFLRYAREKGLL